MPRKKRVQGPGRDEPVPRSKRARRAPPPCGHVAGIDSAAVRGFLLDPSRWMCAACGTTSHVWVCLCCGYCGCDSEVEDHMGAHFSETGHRLAMEINAMVLMEDGDSENQSDIYCGTCSRTVTPGEMEGKLWAPHTTVLRSILSQVQTLNFGGGGGGGSGGGGSRGSSRGSSSSSSSSSSGSSRGSSGGDADPRR